MGNSIMTESKLGFLENFLLSGAAASVSKTAAAPIERVKLLIQNQDELIRQGRLDRRYNGIVDCTTRVFRSEGLAAFWRGNLVNVLRYFPTQALNFAFKDSIKSLFVVPKESAAYKRFSANIASGGFAGLSSSAFVYSLDYARTRLSSDAKSKGARQFNGLIDVYVKTFQSDGIGGLYRGFTINGVGIFIYRGLYFGLYDSLKPMVLGTDAGFWMSFLLGWWVTTTASLISYPIDTVRRRMMMTSGAEVKYKGSLDCFNQVIKTEGFMSLMKGAGANVLRGVAGAGVLAGFDIFKALYVEYRTRM